MSDIAIRVDNLSKLYPEPAARAGHLGAVHQRPDTLRDALTGFVSRMRRSSRIAENDPSHPRHPRHSSSDDLWALRDVSFEVKRGEVVGTPALASGASVIGRNGAGKSTLLKILSRITEPTSGYAETCGGRVGSLLEVGTGSPGDPELTGRENIRYASTARSWACTGSRSSAASTRPVLNLSKHRGLRRDAVLSAAEGSSAFWTPRSRRRVACSGMYVRLAFAVAAHLEPEILLVDEVLAVGDATHERSVVF